MFNALKHLTNAGVRLAAAVLGLAETIEETDKLLRHRLRLPKRLVIPKSPETPAIAGQVATSSAPATPRPRRGR